MGDKATRGINRSLRITIPGTRSLQALRSERAAPSPGIRSKLLEQVGQVGAGGRAMPFGVAFHPAERAASNGAHQPIPMPVPDGANVATVCPAAGNLANTHVRDDSFDHHQYSPASGPLTISNTIADLA